MLIADFAPLYPAGIHEVTTYVLEQVAVSAYPSSVRRPLLFKQFCQWRDSLRARGVLGKCWVDGSFLTEKPEPEDIDLVAFVDLVKGRAPPTPAVLKEIQDLLDRALVKTRFGLDLFLVKDGTPDAINSRSYWRGWYGFCRDGVTAKGIVEIVV